MRKIIYSVCAALLLAATCGEQKAQANAGEMAVFYDNVGWIAAGKAKEVGDAIIAGVKSFQNPKAYNLDGVAEWVEQNTRDGDVDCLVLFGYLPQTIYAPGNGEPEGSLVEEFIDNGNFVMNTADYIFYVTQGGGANEAGWTSEHHRLNLRHVDGRQRHCPDRRREKIYAKPRQLHLQPLL